MRDHCQICGHKVKEDRCAKCGADDMERLVAGCHGADRVSRLSERMVNIILTDRRLLVFDDNVSAVVAGGAAGGGVIGLLITRTVTKNMTLKNGKKDLDIALSAIRTLQRQDVTRGVRVGVHLLVGVDDKTTHDLFIGESFTHPRMPPEYFVQVVGETARRPVDIVA